MHRVSGLKLREMFVDFIFSGVTRFPGIGSDLFPTARCLQDSVQVAGRDATRKEADAHRQSPDQLRHHVDAASAE